MMNFKNGYIQIAGVIDREEADLLIGCGVKYIGFPLRLPVHKEDLSEEEAAAIISKFNPPVYGVLITYLKTAGEILKLARDLKVRIVQLHDDITTGELAILRDQSPGIKIIKSIIVDETDPRKCLNGAAEYGSFCDAFILDTFDPVTGATGATGKVHDWDISGTIVSMSEIPVILAGGLNPSNVKSAIHRVKPAGVDVHTGVENTAGRKDPALVTAFIREATEAFEDIY